MKRFTIFETSIIGVLVGTIVAAYLTFATSTNGFIGTVLNWVSFRPFINSTGIFLGNELVRDFFFYIVVYALYGALIGLFLKKTSWTITSTIAIALVGIAIISEQILGGSGLHTSTNTDNVAAVFIPVAALHQKAKVQDAPVQYFGMEAYGDLDNDAVADVAFIIPRYAEHTNTTYYMTAAIATSTGHIGTNLLYLGNTIKPQTISINNGTVIITYTKGNATSTKEMYARIINNNLQWSTTTQAFASSTPH